MADNSLNEQLLEQNRYILEQEKVINTLRENDIFLRNTLELAEKSISLLKKKEELLRTSYNLTEKKYNILKQKCYEKDKHYTKLLDK